LHVSAISGPRGRVPKKEFGISRKTLNPHKRGRDFAKIAQGSPKMTEVGKRSAAKFIVILRIPASHRYATRRAGAFHQTATTIGGQERRRTSWRKIPPPRRKKANLGVLKSSSIKCLSTSWDLSFFCILISFPKVLSSLAYGNSKGLSLQLIPSKAVVRVG